MVSFPRVEIETISTRLSTETTFPKMQISGQIADVEIKTTPHRFDVYKKDAEITVHNYPVWAQIGMKSFMDLSYEASDRGKSEGKRAVSQYVSQGDQMMAIENKTDAVAEIASQNYSMYMAPGNVNVKYFPDPPPSVEVTPGSVTGSYSPGHIETVVNKKLDIRAELGKVTTVPDRYFKVNIEVVGGQFDRTG